MIRGFDDGREIARFAVGVRDFWVFGMSPDARYLVTQGAPALGVWDVDRASLVWTAPADYGGGGLAFSPDRRRIAVTVARGILVHDLTTGQSSRWSAPGAVHGIAYRPDGIEIAASCEGSPRAVAIFDADTLRPVRTFSVAEAGPVAWSPGGSTLAIYTETTNRISLYSASRGERGPTLETRPDSGAELAFHPSGTLLAKNGWEGRLRLWDVGSGRERLAAPSDSHVQFSPDGRLLVRRDGAMRPWQVEPGLEFTTLSFASDRAQNYGRPSVHRDGRLLAVGTDQGLILWDLARGVELGYLPLGKSWHSAFDPSGDLITNGVAGVLRWPVRTDPKDGHVRIGPPRFLPLRGSDCGISFDRTGRMVAVAGHGDARVAGGDRTITIGPLNDCRVVSLSPDGRWLTTN